MTQAIKTYDTDEIFTLPNILSFLRLLGVPIFLWLILDRHEDLVAVAVLVLSGFSDWLDGHLARKWHQVSRLGQVLDPIADRMYIFAIIIGFYLRNIIPIWLLIILISRDLFLLGLMPVIRRLGYRSLPVHLVGKAATFCLLYAFPLVLLGTISGFFFSIAKVFGWAFVIWGTGLYWWAGLLYFWQTCMLARGISAKNNEKSS